MSFPFELADRRKVLIGTNRWCLTCVTGCFPCLFITYHRSQVCSINILILWSYACGFIFDYLALDKVASYLFFCRFRLSTSRSRSLLCCQNQSMLVRGERRLLKCCRLVFKLAFEVCVWLLKCPCWPVGQIFCRARIVRKLT